MGARTVKGSWQCSPVRPRVWWRVQSHAERAVTTTLSLATEGGQGERLRVLGLNQLVGARRGVPGEKT